jgi:DNA-binding transcriptional MerR regulator
VNKGKKLNHSCRGLLVKDGIGFSDRMATIILRSIFRFICCPFVTFAVNSPHIIFFIAMPYKEIKIEKLYYTIGEVAKMFDVNTSHIRFWEKEFDIIKPHKNKKGNRLFTQHDVDNFHLIYHLVKQKGLTLKGAAKKLKENREDAVNNFEVVKNLEQVKEMLLDLKENL